MTKPEMEKRIEELEGEVESLKTRLDKLEGNQDPYAYNEIDGRNAFGDTEDDVKACIEHHGKYP